MTNYVPPAAPAPAKKKKPRAEVPGVKTSEFWLTILGISLPIVNQAAGLGLDTNSIFAAVATIAAYAAGRGIAKRGPAPAPAPVVIASPAPVVIEVEKK